MTGSRSICSGMTIMIFILSGLLAGCGKREICDFSHPHRGQMVYAFDWQHLFPGAAMPGRLVMCFYSETRDTLIRYVMPNEKGCLVLPADQYKLLLFNEELTSLQLEEPEHLHTVRITHPCGPDGTVASAEPFYACIAGPLTMTPDGEVRHTFTMQRYSQKISFALQVNGLFHPVTCSGRLDGLVSSLLLVTCTDAGSAPVSAVFPLSVEGSKLSGILYTLGVQVCAENADLLTLDFTDPDGQAYSVRADITEALGKMVNGEIDISLLIEGDEISGIKATVAAWETGGEVTVVI